MPSPQMLCVYQFKVALRGISPMIWRRLLLRSDHSCRFQLKRRLTAGVGESAGGSHFYQDSARAKTETEILNKHIQARREP